MRSRDDQTRMHPVALGGIYQRTSRRRWTFRQSHCLSNDKLAFCPPQERGGFKLTPGKVTTLQHEFRDDTVEGASFVSKSVLVGSELTEVPGGLGNDFVVEPEDDATQGRAVDFDVKLDVY